jgi:phosphoadenosine phosphosulfate reductase
MDALFDRHKNVALSFSGGKDSLALLHLMRPWWDRLTVYWLNPGNPFPETVEQMAQVRELVPHFKEVAGLQREIIAADGWPSDVVPHRYTTYSNAIFGPTPFKVQARLQCCIRSMMVPLWRALRADGVTCVLRGKRRSEADRTGIESGHVAEGIEIVFPLLDWSTSDVFRFLEERDVDLPATYRHASHSLDCMDCTAWWGEGQGAYLKAAHPAMFRQYARRIWLIKRAVADQLDECEV